MFISLYM